MLYLLNYIAQSPLQFIHNETASARTLLTCTLNKILVQVYMLQASQSRETGEELQQRH